jgi:hypothetical protein
MSKKQTAPKKPEYNRRAIYVGRRKMMLQDKVAHEFLLLPELTPMQFSGRIKGVWLGYTYKCTDSSIALKPERDDEFERQDNPEWEGADAAAEAYLAERRAEAKLRRDTRPSMRAAIQALRPLVRNLAGWERSRLIDYLSKAAADQNKRKRK